MCTISIINFSSKGEKFVLAVHFVGLKWLLNIGTVFETVKY